MLIIMAAEAFIIGLLGVLYWLEWRERTFWQRTAHSYQEQTLRLMRVVHDGIKP